MTQLADYHLANGANLFEALDLYEQSQDTEPMAVFQLAHMREVGLPVVKVIIVSCALHDAHLSGCVSRQNPHVAYRLYARVLIDLQQDPELVQSAQKIMWDAKVARIRIHWSMFQIFSWGSWLALMPHCEVREALIQSGDLRLATLIALLMLSVTTVFLCRGAIIRLCRWWSPKTSSQVSQEDQRRSHRRS